MPQTVEERFITFGHQDLDFQLLVQFPQREGFELPRCEFDRLFAVGAKVLGCGHILLIKIRFVI